ncbi:MAG: Hsp20/alpha crystallin family protein [Thermomicrobiales bacterium]
MMILRRGRSVQVMGATGDAAAPYEMEAPLTRRHDRPGPWRPPIEVYETGGELVVRAEIAGLSGGEIEVTVERDLLEIKGERPLAPCIDPRMYHESRIRYGPFLVAIHVPFPVDDRAATADYREGLLTVTLPRKEASRIATLERAHRHESGQ